MTREPFWKIESKPDGMTLSKDGRTVVLPWRLLAQVAEWRGPEKGSAPLAFADSSVRLSIDQHGVSVKVSETPRAIRLPFTMIRSELERRLHM